MSLTNAMLKLGPVWNGLREVDVELHMRTENPPDVRAELAAIRKALRDLEHRLSTPSASYHVPD